MTASKYTDGESYRQRTARWRAEVLDVIKRRGRSYSVEVATALGWGSQGKAVARAANAMRVLEREGLLTSELVPAPSSGMGRRYFDLPALGAPASTSGALARGGEA